MKKNPLFLIAGIALLIAVADVPYSYYQLLRWLVCGVGAYGAYISYQKKKIEWIWILGAIALVFNPFAKFYFTKEVWKVVDLIAGVLFCIYWGKQSK